LLTALDLPTDAVGQTGKPLAVLIDRKGQTRDIENIDEIGALMKTHCPHCHVEVVELHNMGVVDQIQLISRASVLVGLHGSGLAHAVWMRESAPNHTTHLIEILPYNYTCRDWYHTAAVVAGVQYHFVMNERPAASASLAMCWARPELCATISCHDPLRDQPTRVEAGPFTKAWKMVADELKSTIVTQ
jgi:capsular polysaccharide biosynthesis protein